MFHDRLYGPTIKETFQYINDVETAKWAAIDMGFSDVGMGSTKFKEYADF
jgi:hypothetical protein